jgi:DNA-binding NarL/FixJ family response regulator
VDPLTRASAPVRVVLVDDERLVRTGLRLILGGEPSVEVVGEAGDGVEAEHVIAETLPDVVLMDIRMPRRDGLAATERELARRPDLAVLVLTTFDADDMVLGALRLGARGFLLKDTPPAELVAAVLAAPRRGRPRPPRPGPVSPCSPPARPTSCAGSYAVARTRRSAPSCTSASRR